MDAQVDGLGRSLLFVAVVHQRRAAIEFLLENTSHFDINHRASSGNAALHAAVTAEDVDIVGSDC